MNKSYYETLDENFKQALNLYETEYTHDELINMLKNGNIVQKQISTLKLDTINSKLEAQIFVSNLTGQDGKVREAVSFKLKEFMSDTKLAGYFKNEENYKIFLDAVIDINGNICRNVIEAITNLKEDDEFCNIFCSGLSDLTLSLIDIIEKFDFRDGKYKINKEAFKLYWCLETIYYFYDKIDFNKLKEIISRAKNISEYTIREKCAKILSTPIKDRQLDSIRNELKKDPNYYVRRFI
ncbi:hypothetical protein J6G99_05535 [bacterium]|nr:hypothetical protein [bacterium]